jgi:hypothetical protein
VATDNYKIIDFGETANDASTYKFPDKTTGSYTVAMTSDLDAVARTGAVVAFDLDAVYNSIASPSSSNITFDLTGARLKIVQKMYHNSATEPTVAGGVRRGTGSYVPSTLNIIYLEWSVGTTVEYWITQ